MEVYLWAFLGGLVGAALMDITETWAARAGIRSGVSIALVGRWVIGLAQGRFVHSDILECRPYPREVGVGWLFHFLVGGGAVALFYPLFFTLTGLPMPGNHLLGGLLFGLATSVLPWFVLLPSFGWGFFGRRGPSGSNALLASTLSHIPYGLGVGAVMALALRG
jgi:hypothetical protein